MISILSIDISPVHWPVLHAFCCFAKVANFAMFGEENLNVKSLYQYDQNLFYIVNCTKNKTDLECKKFLKMD